MGRGGHYLPQGPWLKGSCFRRLPTKRPWRKSCDPHNNSTAPGPSPHRKPEVISPLSRNADTLMLPATRPHILMKREVSNGGGDTFKKKKKKKIYICMYMKQKGLHFALYGLTCNTDITILETSYAVSYLYWDNQIFRFLTEKKNKTQQGPKRGGMQVRVRKTPLSF